MLMSIEPLIFFLSSAIEQLINMPGNYSVASKLQQLPEFSMFTVSLSLFLSLRITILFLLF
jgi:hypothetical protein